MAHFKFKHYHYYIITICIITFFTTSRDDEELPLKALPVLANERFDRQWALNHRSNFSLSNTKHTGKAALYTQRYTCEGLLACPLCKVESQTLEHWLQRCPNLDVLQQHKFGSTWPPLWVLTTNPEKVRAFAKATF